MCDPVTVLGVTSLAMTATGSIQQNNSARAAGKAQQNYYDYVAEQNKQSADAALAAGEQKSNLAQFKGSQDSAKYMREASEFRGLQRATGTAMGIGSGSVTSEDIAYDTLTKEQLDEKAIRYNADIASWSAKSGALYEAWDFGNQAELNKMAGKNARIAGNNQGIASLIGGATSIASQGLSLARYSTPSGVKVS